MDMPVGELKLLRTCKHCYRVYDDPHDVYCPFGSGIAPVEAKKGNRGGNSPGGGGGSDPGDPNFPIIPDSPSGRGVAVDCGEIRAGVKSLSRPEIKRDMIEHRPDLQALPAPEVEVTDYVRDHRVGKR